VFRPITLIGTIGRRGLSSITPNRSITLLCGMNNMLGKSIIVKSGQGWKLAISVVTFVASWGGIIVLLSSDGGGRQSVLTLMALIVFGLIGLLFSFLAIKCPVCRSHWVWVAASKRSKSEWPMWFLKLRECPKCGYEGQNAT
jgi:hypothetical protein